MRKLLAIAGLLVLLLAAGAQDITTADQFFGKLADRYAKINDYEGSILIKTGTQSMTGKIWFKAPSLLRIDFSQPPDQVILFDGERLVVYIPQYRAVLQQDAGDQGLGAAALASREGLQMMKRSYTVGWETNPTPAPLDPGSSESVVKLMLNRKTVAEGFRTLRLSVNPTTLLIRRIEGWTVSNDRVSFDLTGVSTNQGVPSNRFLYDSPASANVYNNFLFKSGD